MALYVRPLGPDEQRHLESLVHRSDEPDVAKRAQLVILSAKKWGVHEISRSVGLHPINVRKWLHRFNRFGVRGLYPRRSPGRPQLFGPQERRVIVELATMDPQTMGLEFSGWSLQRLRSQLIRRGIVEEISAETIRQELIRSGLVFEDRHWVEQTA